MPLTLSLRKSLLLIHISASRFYQEYPGLNPSIVGQASEERGGSVKGMPVVLSGEKQKFL